MVALRSRRLDALFGARLDDVQAQHLQALVTQQVQEAFDLEYKAELYGSSDSDKRAWRLMWRPLPTQMAGYLS
jgi:hypothetical protein